MIIDIEILESQLTFKDDDWILLTDENKDIIGRKLEEQGYTWPLGDVIRNSMRYQPGQLLHIDEEYKMITWSRIFKDKDILNYNIIQIDI